MPHNSSLNCLSVNSRPMSKLFLVPTPIGNLKDMTCRAVEVLGTVDLILAEDTRQASKLLKRYEIKTPLQSHHMFNEHKTIESVCTKILSGKTIALISDAGTPGISDPGFMLVRKCIEKGIPVETLPAEQAVDLVLSKQRPDSSIHLLYNGGKGEVYVQNIMMKVTLSSGQVIQQYMNDGNRKPRRGDELVIEGTRSADFVQVYLTSAGRTYKVKEESLVLSYLQ